MLALFFSLVSLALAQNSVEGQFECSYENAKSTYCPGEKITWVIKATNPQLQDKDGVPSFLSCEIRGSEFGKDGKTRQAGPRGFVGNCNSGIGASVSLKTFLEKGGKTEVEITNDMVGFEQNIQGPLFFEGRQVASNLLLAAGKCPTFSVSECTGTSTSSGLPSSYSTSTSSAPLASATDTSASVSEKITASSLVLFLAFFAMQ